ncbi:unnamed protein product [Mesocestoides corti]|uniref:Uncharacterized protein n=1 Tax=Mesocestoides corti TaxID=53468 RepID=A0A0R3U5T5_MESCO|nr:unnamed protein product [Mesocestoides corti]
MDLPMFEIISPTSALGLMFKMCHLIMKLLFSALFYASTLTPVKIPWHQGTRTIVYNSTLHGAWSSIFPEWTLNPRNNRPLLYKIFIHKIVLPGDVTSCKGDARLVISDVNNVSVTYCGSINNIELRILALQLSVKILTSSAFKEEIIVNISYDIIDPSSQSVSPVCGRQNGTDQRFWACDPKFRASTFSETVCVPSAEICDGIEQCPNGEDENLATCAILNEGTSNCLPFAKFCDGVPDCLSGFDEDRCGNTNNKTCPNETFLCQQDAKCLPQNKVCDGIQDCIDFHDESQFSCEWKKSHSDWIENVCLSFGVLCNGFVDCSDGYDENINLFNKYMYLGISRSTHSGA